jgi:hypothetical protein
VQDAFKIGLEILCWAPTRTRIRTRRRIGLGLVLESGLPTGDEIGPTSGSHNLTSKERIEEVTERGSENGRTSSVMGRNRFR